MKDKVESLRKKFGSFRKGEEDPLAVRLETMILLEEAKENGDPETLNEIEDMLMDLQFAIEENKCNCHRKRSRC